MATPLRRSTRLRGSGTPARAPIPSNTNGLGSVTERDETPNKGGQDLDIKFSQTPARTMPGSFDADMKTPESGQQLKPAHEKMHPEHAHHSTVKVSNTGLELGFLDVNPYQSSPLRPSNQVRNMSPPQPAPFKSSPGYEFNFNRGGTALGTEGQRIMDSLHEETNQIRLRLEKEMEEQVRRDEAAGIVTGGRRVAKPKSRFSDVHEAEFSKMQSIANHVSLWKNKRSPTKDQTLNLADASRTPVLKRPHSKADLEVVSKSTLKRTKSKADLVDEATDASPSKRLASPQPVDAASPSKRRKALAKQDVSDVRPTSREAPSSTIPTPRKTGLPSVATSPTKASLARLSSSKASSPSKAALSGRIPRSRSFREMASSSRLRTASDRIASAVANKVNSVKSILHRPQPKYSDDPKKIMAGTHIPIPKPTPSGHASTPSAPASPHPNHTLPRPTPKRVEFTADTKDAIEAARSPSPTKVAVSQHLQAPETDRLPSADITSSPLADRVVYPSLMESLQRDSSPVRSPQPQARVNPLFSHPPSAGDFTFTHDKRIVFSSNDPSPEHSPRAPLTSIRHVHEAGIPTPVFASRMNVPERFPAVSHGIANKKRARADGQESSDIENRDPSASVEPKVRDGDGGSPRKKAKMAEAPPRQQSSSPVKRSPIKGARRQTGMGAGAPAAAPKKGLSLARINFLARPKERR